MSIQELRNQLIISRILYYFGAIVVGLLFLSIFLFIYWANASYDPLVFNYKDKNGNESRVLPVLNKNKTVENGGYLALDADFCKTVDVEGNLEVYLVGTTTKTQLVYPKERGQKRCIHTPAPIKLPELVNIEPRHLEFKIIYQVNPIRTVTEEFRTEQFLIRE